MSGLMQIEFEYYSRNAFEKFDLEKQKIFHERLPKIFRKKDDENYDIPYSGDNIIDIDEAQFLLDNGLEFKLKRFKGTIPYSIPGTDQKFATLHIHLPNYDLHSFNEVEVREDLCTDELQNLLDEGWRILAVCPPKSQRRPDYIMARQKQR